MTRPLAIDLFCGLGGWTDGLLAEGWDVVGFDIEEHVYGEQRYPAQLVLQDVRTIHGKQFKHAQLIVASSPCQAYSYMAMPWTRAKQIAAALRGRGEFPEGYNGARTIAELNELFEQPARIQREACEAAGRFIPMVQENVKGTQPWVGDAAWHHGSFYLWGNVPALMPITLRTGMKNTGGSWFNVAHNTTSGVANNPARGRGVDGVKGFTPDGQPLGKNVLGRKHGSKSKARKRASAEIAKIPFALSSHIARVYYPNELRASA